MKKIPLTFYQQADTLQISQSLIGKYLFTCFDHNVTGGMIIETEAYCGAEDKACHAYKNRRTKRTSTMFLEGGCIYVYLCYGMHSLLNIVTNKLDVPHAILIRAIHPEVGIETMLERRGKQKLDRTLASGPGSLCRALGVTRAHDRLSLDSPYIWLEDRGVNPSNVSVSPRIGIDYAEEDALKPWRFFQK